MDHTQEDIVGGTDITDYPAVVFTSTGGGNCTGTLIAPRVILTAAHCVFGEQGGSVQFGFQSGAMGNQSKVMQRLLPHRYYNPGAIRNYDIALIRLESAPTAIDPMPYNTDPLGQDLVGAQAHIIGFGVTNGTTMAGAGVKRELMIPVSQVTSEHLIVGNASQNICFGDSGGPTFLTISGQERVVAVSSFTTGKCDADSYVTRTDKYASDFVNEVVAAWSGPCEQDGNCVATGCGAFEDPDCNPCGLEGTCATGCPKVDLDCPKGGDLGDDCNNNDSCESRACVAAIDDSTVNYCAVRCSEGDSSPCVAPLSLCQQAADGEFYCTYDGQTPRARGAECEASTDCRSNICDQSAGICATRCGEGEAECPSPYSCIEASGVKICTKQSGGCGCTTRPTSGAIMLALFTALSLVRVTRRRRAASRVCIRN